MSYELHDPVVSEEPEDEDGMFVFGDSVLRPGEIQLLTLNQLDVVSPPRESQVEGILFQDSIVLIYAQPECGKSFFALSLALAPAFERPWYGRTAAKGTAVYIAAEGGSSLAARAKAWAWEQPCFMGFPSFYVINRPVNFLAGEEEIILNQLDDAALRPRVVVIDTLDRCMGDGDENSARDMRLFINACDEIRCRTGAAVIVVHHSTKDGGSERGSSSLRAAADTVFRIRRKGDIVVVSCTKQRDAAKFDDLRFRLKQVVLGEDNLPGSTSCVLVPVDDGEVADDLSETSGGRSVDRVLDALREQFPDSGARWTELLEGSTLAKSTFSRVLNRLLDQGVVTKVKDSSGPGSLYVLKQTPGESDVHAPEQSR